MRTAEFHLWAFLSYGFLVLSICMYNPSLCHQLILLGYSQLLVLISLMKNLKKIYEQSDSWGIFSRCLHPSQFPPLRTTCEAPLNQFLYFIFTSFIFIFSSFITDFPHNSFLYHFYYWRYTLFLSDEKLFITTIQSAHTFGRIVLLSIPFISMCSVKSLHQNLQSLAYEWSHLLLFLNTDRTMLHRLPQFSW